MGEFTHFNNLGEAVMVDVSDKKETVREATARGKITMSPECLQKIMEGQMGKGDVLGGARIAGIMGAKKTSELIPLCHVLNLTKVEMEFYPDLKENAVFALCRVRTVGKTGVEMEALTGVSTALLTIYDMCKAVDKSMLIENICLIKKTGGKSGTFIKTEESGEQ